MEKTAAQTSDEPTLVWISYPLFFCITTIGLILYSLSSIYVFIRTKCILDSFAKWNIGVNIMCFAVKCAVWTYTLSRYKELVQNLTSIEEIEKA